MTWRKLKRLFQRRNENSVQGVAPHSIRFLGNYANWESATKDAVGYDAAIILKKTRDALLKVKNGEAAYERDSVLFDKIQYSFPVLAGLLRAAQTDDRRLCVVDFGGALGSSYFQCRPFLAPIKKLEWLIVEQASHIACGKEHFASEQLFFYNSVEECLKRHQPNALVLSSVLQYLPNPYETMKQLMNFKIPHVIIDRTAFLASDKERLTVQHVPDSIYPASYPAWFFSESKFTSAISSAGYNLVTDFPGSDDISPEGEKGYFKGFIYEWCGRI